MRVHQQQPQADSSPSVSQSAVYTTCMQASSRERKGERTCMHAPNRVGSIERRRRERKRLLQSNPFIQSQVECSSAMLGWLIDPSRSLSRFSVWGGDGGGSHHVIPAPHQRVGQQDFWQMKRETRRDLRTHTLARGINNGLGESILVQVEHKLNNDMTFVWKFRTHTYA